MALRRIHLTKKGEKWSFEEAKSDKAIFTAKTKEEAMKKLIAYCNKNATAKDPISAKIHGVDGKIKEERTYPRSADPKGSKG